MISYVELARALPQCQHQTNFYSDDMETDCYYPIIPAIGDCFGIEDIKDIMTLPQKIVKVSLSTWDIPIKRTVYMDSENDEDDFCYYIEEADSECFIYYD